MPRFPFRSCFVAALFVGAVSVTGCASDENKEACTAYVEHLQSLDCFEGDVSVASTCPENFDGSGFSCSEFFTCLTNNASCDGDTFVNDAQQCQACTTN